jgi:hypothetical protein
MVGPEEHAALKVVLGGLKDGLALLPAASAWTPCLREFKNGLVAQIGEQDLDRLSPVRREAFGRDDLAA